LIGARRINRGGSACAAQLCVWAFSSIYYVCDVRAIWMHERQATLLLSQSLHSLTHTHTHTHTKRLHCHHPTHIHTAVTRHAHASNSCFHLDVRPFPTSPPTRDTRTHTHTHTHDAKTQPLSLPHGIPAHTRTHTESKISHPSAYPINRQAATYTSRKKDKEGGARAMDGALGRDEKWRDHVPYVMSAHGRSAQDRKVETRPFVLSSHTYQPDTNEALG